MISSALRRLLDAVMCRLGKCRRCKIFDTPAGIGGRCDNCGQLHGWMSHEELRAILDGRRGGHFETPIDKYDTVKVTPPRMYLVRGPRGWQ